MVIEIDLTGADKEKAFYNRVKLAIEFILVIVNFGISSTGNTKKDSVSGLRVEEFLIGEGIVCLIALIIIYFRLVSSENNDNSFRTFLRFVNLITSIFMIIWMILGIFTLFGDNLSCIGDKIICNYALYVNVSNILLLLKIKHDLLDIKME